MIDPEPTRAERPNGLSAASLRLLRTTAAERPHRPAVVPGTLDPYIERYLAARLGQGEIGARTVREFRYAGPGDTDD